MKSIKQSHQFIQDLPDTWTIKIFQDLLVEPVRNGIYKKKEFHGRGQKVINMGELFAYDFISNQEMKRVELNTNELKNSLVQNGDLLFARRSLVLEGSGKCSLIVNPSEDTTFESSIIRARLDKTKASPKFYYFFFHSPMGRSLMASIATQTAVSGIRGSDLVQLEIPYPPLPIQEKIADILSAYDELIENNTRQIKILEEMAQLIYREWFVNFRFPGHEQVKMVDSQLGLIPEGWEVKILEDVAAINATTLKKNQLQEINYIDISSVSTGQIDKIETISFLEAPSRARRIVKHGDIIWSTVRPNRKAYSCILNPDQNLIVSTGFAVITAINVPYTYLYYAVTTESFVNYLTKNATGSAYPAVNSDDFKKAKILMASKDILTQFHTLVEDIFQQKQLAQIETLNLRQTRDLLLPKLISGEINLETLKSPELELWVA